MRWAERERRADEDGGEEEDERGGGHEDERMAKNHELLVRWTLNRRAGVVMSGAGRER